MKEILIAEASFDRIVEAVREGRDRRIELGGSLIAHEDQGSILVAYAVPTGPRAEQGPGHLRTDAAFQNAAIARVRRWCPGLTYVGDWHVHPMYLPQLSGTDRRTARDILLDEGAHRDHLVLLLGTAATRTPPIVLGFVARLDGRKEIQIEEVPLRRVSADSHEVTSRLARPLAPLEELLADEDGSSSTVAHDAAARIEADLEAIREELGAEASLWAADDALGAIVRRGDRDALVLFPPEYPVGAPQVFSGSLERGPLEAVPLRYAWSSRHRLADPVEEALEPPGQRPPSRGQGTVLGRLLRPLLALAAALRPQPLLSTADPTARSASHEEGRT